LTYLYGPMYQRSECKEESRLAHEILRYTQDDKFVDALNTRILCRFRCEIKCNDNLILRNCDVGQVGRLDAEISHVNGAGCSPS
jgi:hypothetical protein